MSKLSIAYNEGFNSKKYDNPYNPSTQEYNDFERGWCQRVKHGLPIIESPKVNTTETYKTNIIKAAPVIKRE